MAPRYPLTPAPVPTAGERGTVRGGAEEGIGGSAVPTGPRAHSISRTIERDQTMRRLLFSFLAMTFVGTIAGCNTTHGVCDCTHDYDEHCAYRSPWISEAAHKADAPTPMPEIREALPSSPKKL